MVLSKMYCSEQIVIPEKISNLLKTYAKAALKTQPYDLLRWSAAYFRCLSLDVLPPVKPRYEHENVFGCLTKGYLKVLLSQVGKGFFVRRDILEHRWNGLCLPEDELLKFLSLTRMLYWPQVHWLKLMAVMVGSINQNFHETTKMLCELLTDEPEGGSSPVPLWLFRECFKFLAELNCNDEQTFFDGKKIISDGVLEDETRMPNIPRKLSSITFKNAVIDYWNYRIENVEKEKSHHGEANLDDEKGESNAEADFANLQTLSLQSSPMRDGSDFRITGEFQNPKEIIKRSSDFESVIVVLQQLKCDEEFQPESRVTEKQRKEIAQRDAEVEEMREKLSQMTEGNAHSFLAQECCNLLKDIGPPWNWLHNFASQTCREKSYNFLESAASVHSDVTPNEVPSSEDSFDYLNDKFLSAKPSTTSTASKSSASEASGNGFAVYNVDEEDDEASNSHKVLIDTICSISEASDKGECNIRETSSVASFLEEQHSKKHLTVSDYQRLKKFIDRAEERKIVFNDLNELYNYFIQEASRERSTHEVEIYEEEEEVEVENVIESSTERPKVVSETGKATEKTEKAESKNVVSIFGESGIEVDGKLLDAKVSESMILGLVDKPHLEDNLSDVASSVSSLSQAETVKMKQQNVTRERDTQTVSYKEQIHSKRIQCKQAGKSKSASSIKRQPFACKIPPLPGIGSAMDGERLEKILRFIAHRSFQQGGFAYPRNFMEDECPELT